MVLIYGTRSRIIGSNRLVTMGEDQGQVPGGLERTEQEIMYIALIRGTLLSCW